MSGRPPPFPPTIGTISLITLPAFTLEVRSYDTRTIMLTLPSASRPLHFFLETLDRIRKIVALSFQRRETAVDQTFVLTKPLECIESGYRANPSDTGSDRFVGCYLERTDIARRSYMRTAAQLLREDAVTDT